MLVFYLGTASVDTLVDLSVAVQVIIAAVLGGRRTILGAVLGSIFLLLADEALRPLGQLTTFVVSAVALARDPVLPRRDARLCAAREANAIEDQRRSCDRGRASHQAFRRPGRGQGHQLRRFAPGRSSA